MSERVRKYLAGEPGDRVWTNEHGDVIAQEPGPVRVGSEREGWRARLAMVLRDLEEAREFCLRVGVSAAGLNRGIAEVRSMIDGDETTP